MVIRVALIAAALSVLTACIGQRPAATREILDEQTGNTLFVAAQPLMFARDRTDVAAHARDYVKLIAVAVNETGKYGVYLLVHRWSTVDRRMLPPRASGADELRLLADERVIDLEPLDRVPADLASRTEFRAPNHGDAITRAYKIDVPTLRFVAASRALSLRLPKDPLDTPFGLWRDGRSDLMRFVEANGR
jgi:hypothetical protein